MRLLTAAEIGAFLGITAAGVRQIVKRHRIEAAGKAGRANLYDPHDVFRAAGHHDRRMGA